MLMLIIQILVPVRGQLRQEAFDRKPRLQNPSPQNFGQHLDQQTGVNGIKLFSFVIDDKA